MHHDGYDGVRSDGAVWKVRRYRQSHGVFVPWIRVYILQTRGGEGVCSYLFDSLDLSNLRLFVIKIDWLLSVMTLFLQIHTLEWNLPIGCGLKRREKVLESP
ncbi:unnamed protein product [Brassica oleracea]